MPTEIPPGARVMHVHRGNQGCVIPITREAFAKTRVGDLAGAILATLLRAQMAAPGRASDPIRMDDTPVALRLADRDKPLDPDLPLRAQTEGRWEFKDLPVEGQTESTARLPVCEFELIDVERPVLVLPSPSLN